MPGRLMSAGWRAAALLLAGSAAVGTPATEASAMQASGEVREGEHAGEHGTRRYRLFIPARAAAGSTGMPLVVMLHGCTQDAADFAAGTRADEAAERAGALVLYPEQPASAHPQKCWSWYDPAHQGRGAGEPALLAGMIREVMEETGADPDRVYVAGISAGGSMAQILAAAYPEMFAGLAVHSAPAYRSAADVPSALAVLQQGVGDPAALPALVLEAMGTRARRLPTLVIHGDADPVVRVVNGRQAAEQWRGVAAKVAGGAQGEGKTQGGSEVTVRYLEVPGLGHAWSGGSPAGTYTDPSTEDATAAVFAFFLGPVAAEK